MNLTDRLENTAPSTDPEDLLFSSLAVIFPDTVANQHGDASNALLYASPRLPHRLRLALADPPAEDDRLLFGHYLWNASLLTAELVERAAVGEGKDSVGEGEDGGGGERGGDEPAKARPSTFDPRNKSIIEVGAGTALPSTMAALLGAAEVVVTDYPSHALMSTLRANVARNIARENSPAGYVPGKVEVLGHAWGDLAGMEGRRHAYDVVIAADCLWMPWQHQHLLSSTAHFLKRDPSARAWVVAGFHTGRRSMRGFFDASFLRGAGLEAEALWEVDCMGAERAWAWEREGEDAGEEVKRWCAVGILKWADL